METLNIFKKLDRIDVFTIFIQINATEANNIPVNVVTSCGSLPA